MAREFIGNIRVEHVETRADTFSLLWEFKLLEWTVRKNITEGSPSAIIVVRVQTRVGFGDQTVMTVWTSRELNLAHPGP